MCIPGSPSAAVRKCIPCHCWRSLAFRQEVLPEGMLLLLPSGLCVRNCVYTLCFMLKWNTYIRIHVFPCTSVLLSEIKFYHFLLPFPPLSPSELPSLESSQASPRVDSCFFFDWLQIYTYLRMDKFTHIYYTHICDDGSVVPKCCICVGLFDCFSPLAAYIVFPGTSKPNLRKEALRSDPSQDEYVSWVCDVSSNRGKEHWGWLKPQRTLFFYTYLKLYTVYNIECIRCVCPYLYKHTHTHVCVCLEIK